MLMKTPTETEQYDAHVMRRIASQEAKKRAEINAARRDQERSAQGPKWYIVQCIRGSDQQALDAFERFKIETYYPKIIQLKPMPRKRMSASQRMSGVVVMAPQETALFPRYVFTRFDIRMHGWHEAFEFAGVGGLMSRDRMPLWMPEEKINAIKRRENNGVIPGKEKLRVLFDVGDSVIVTDGPFASFPAIVEEGLDVAIEKLEPSMRIKVAVNIFGRATPVDLEYWQVAHQGK